MYNHIYVCILYIYVIIYIYNYICIYMTGHIHSYGFA